jgi:hypothetical protein
MIQEIPDDFLLADFGSSVAAEAPKRKRTEAEG